MSSNNNPTVYPTQEMMSICADMTLANAIEDMAIEESITKAEAREALLTSKAYHCLYHFDTKMWMEGPDYFRDFYKKCKEDETLAEVHAAGQ